MKKTKYDLTLIINGEKNLVEAQKIFDDIKVKLESLNFQIEKTINPFLKELAFDINKIKQGYYGTFIFTVEDFSNKVLEDMFKHDLNVLRFLTTLHDDSVMVRRVRNSRRGATEVKAEDQKEVVKEEKVEEVVKEVEMTNDQKEEVEAKKEMDLENLDEKLDELLK
jgi:ribosomal protein S6